MWDLLKSVLVLIPDLEISQNGVTVITVAIIIIVASPLRASFSRPARLTRDFRIESWALLIIQSIIVRGVRGRLCL